MNDNRTFEELARMWRTVDPVPDGMVTRMQAVAAAEAATVGADLDYELMLLVERSSELAGTRGGSSYTLRFATEDLELLVRAPGANGETLSRLDGWVLPAKQLTVRVAEVQGDERTYESTVDDMGRFEFTQLPRGMYRLWLVPPEEETPSFGTPAFEI